MIAKRLFKALRGSLCAGVFGLAACTSIAAAAGARYVVVGRIAGPAGIVAWDYATIDSSRGRLYLATLRAGGRSGYAGAITGFDLRTGSVLPAAIEDPMPHKVVVLGHDEIAAADAARNSVDFFEEDTGRSLGRVLTGGSPHPGGWHNPDSLARDPESGLLIAVNHDSGEILLLNVARRRVVARIPVGGILEEAVPAAHGMLFANDASQGQVAVINILARRVVRRLSLERCEEPTGIAYDDADRLVMSVCANGWVKFVDPLSGRELASIGVGRGADGMMYDPLRGTVMIAGGESGTLSVIRVGGRHDIKLVQTLRIPPGTRLGAVDQATGRLYLPSARYDRRAPALRLPGLGPIPRVVPGSFGLIVLAPLAAR